jgi:hypothetical protein
MIYVDADTCPVNAEAARAATRNGIRMLVLSNGGIRPRPLVGRPPIDGGQQTCCIKSPWTELAAKSGRLRRGQKRLSFVPDWLCKEPLLINSTIGSNVSFGKPTKQESLWFHGGNLHQSRHYSQFLSLQLKARMEGIDMPVYGIPETYLLG